MRHESVPIPAVDIAADATGERMSIGSSRTWVQPRSSELAVPARDDRVQRIEELNAHLEAEVREQKYEKMSGNPLMFMRGTAALEAEFRADRTETQRFGTSQETHTWILGDLHVYNMGAYRAPSGKVVYGLNDADEVMIGPYTKDVLRAGSSLHLIAASKGLDQHELLDAFSDGYVDTIRAEADQPGSTRKPLTTKRAEEPMAEFLRKAGKREQGRMLDKWTVLSEDGERDLAVGSNPKLAKMPKDLLTQLHDGLEHSREEGDQPYQVVGLAKRLNMGCGSLGRVVGFALVKEKDDEAKGDDAYHLLILKQAAEPHAFPFMSAVDRQSTLDACEGDHGRRALLGISALQGETISPFAGSMNTKDFGPFVITEYGSVRETIEPMDVDSPKELRRLARQWGQVIASAHCRAADQVPGSEERIPFAKAVAKELKGNRSGFSQWVESESQAFGEVVMEDYAAFCAWRSNRP